MGTRSSGELLREARTRAGLTQAQLATRAGITQSVVSAYEHDRRQPALATLADLVAAAGLELDVGIRARSLPADRLTGPVGRQVRKKRARLVATAAEHGLSRVHVFGSVSRGTENGDSDLDLLVDLPPDMTLVGLVDAQDALEQLMGVPVDLVPADGLKPGLAARIEPDLVRL